MGWLDLPGGGGAGDGPFHFFELFAGRQEVTKVMPSSLNSSVKGRELRNHHGYACASYDWEYAKKAMNFLSPAGFLSLGSCCASGVSMSEACRAGAVQP